MKNKKKLPYFPLYVNDFIGDTQDLTNEEVGAYIRILMYSWGKGKFKLHRIKFICQDDEIWSALEEYFTCEDDLWFNPRMERERERVFGVIEARSEAGKAGAKARWDSKGNAIANGKTDSKSNSKNMPAYNSELITKNLRTSEHKKRVEALFLDFYSDYPKKVGKAQAQKAFHKISPDDDLFDEIMTALKNHTRKWDDPKYIPHPATWLNQKRWEDALEVPTLKPKEKPPTQSCSLCSNKFEADMNTYLEFGGMCPECRKTNTITAVK